MLLIEQNQDDFCPDYIVLVQENWLNVSVKRDQNCEKYRQTDQRYRNSFFLQTREDLGKQA